jgi:hypothetical protein
MRKEQALAVVARTQAGCFSRRQALDAGVTRHEIQGHLLEGTWRALLPCVYCIAAAPRSDDQRLWAAFLWVGDGAHVSHRSAGAMWKYDGVRAGKPELWLPGKCTKRRSDVVTRRAIASTRSMVGS